MTTDVLAEVDLAIEHTTRVPEMIRFMLDERNWRTDLVAIAVALLSPKPADFIEPLWEAFDYGSWVAPQLAASLYLVDTGFRWSAKHRVAARCAPVMGAAVRRCPWDGIAAKNLASLLEMLNRVDEDRAWADAERRSSDVQRLLTLDIDSTSVITSRWYDSVTRALIEFERPPGRPAGWHGARPTRPVRP